MFQSSLVIVHWFLQCSPYQILFLTLLFIGGSNVNFSQGHILNSLESMNSLPNPRPGEPEIALVKFITPLRHKRELTSKDFHIIQIHRPLTNSTTLIHLTKKTSLLSSDFKIVVRDGDETPEIFSREDSKSDCLYHGRIQSDPEGRAALSACGGHLGFSGLIMSREGHWMIEPDTKSIQASPTSEILHVIHRPENDTSSDGTQNQCNSDELRLSPEDLQKAAEFERLKKEEETENETRSEDSTGESIQMPLLDLNPNDDVDDDAIMDEGNGAIVGLGSKPKPKPAQKRQTSTDKKTVEIAVFSDADFYNAMKIRYPKDTMNKIKNYVLTVVNAMDILYEQPSLGVSLDFRLVHLEIQKKWPSKLSKNTGSAKSYLSAFCDYAGNLNTRNELWDHALMLTGTDLAEEGSSATAGLAWAGTMCYRYYSCSISEATQFGVVYVITHEIGHSMGMEHDGEGVSKKCNKEKYLMSPTTGPGKISWSNCSSSNLQDFIRYGTSEPKERFKAILPDCLTESSRESKSIDYTSPSLPGQKYNANKQCNLAMGKRFNSVMRKTTPFNNICSMLYCGNTTHSISTHPALEGTTCETGKHCQGGQCVKT